MTIRFMSAGTGISHSEHNRDEDPLKLFQIWLLARQSGGTPRWDSPKFPKADRAGRLIELASGDPKNAETLITPADGITPWTRPPAIFRSSAAC
jgi:redox-sensitive bicupin YhaK (pirin superfamily)